MLARQGALLLAASVVLTAFVRADEGKQSLSPADALQSFSKAWDDTTWVPQRAGQRGGYLRPDDDQGWKARMTAMQALVRGGGDSSKLLPDKLRDGKPPERILAAQTLGFLDDKTVRDALIKAAESDADGAVRLYAADSLGMLGAADYRQTLERLVQREGNRDAKRHLSYAVDRGANALETSFVEALKGWDSRQIDSAAVGKVAPDFELPSLSGQKVRLSDFRGKSAVVLVFVYGDT